MAVYTDVADDELRAFVALYDIGEVLSCKGIAEGVENSNFLVTTERGNFILTLYEKRVARRICRSFIALMEHLAQQRRRLPDAVARPRRGGAARAVRPAGGDGDVSRRDVAAPHPAVPLRRRRPARWRALHSAGDSFAMTRANDLSVAGWRRLFAACAARADEVQPGLADELAASWRCSNAPGRATCRAGVIHADLFPDNVFFRDRQVSGLIDFYFACTDFLAYDLAVCLNAWCFEADGSLNVTKARLLVDGYRPGAAIVAGRARGAAGAGARQRAALFADAAVRLAQPAGGRPGAAQGPAGVSAQTALSPQRRRIRATMASISETTAAERMGRVGGPGRRTSTSSPTAPAAATPARAAGARSCAFAGSKRSCAAASPRPPTTAWN